MKILAPLGALAAILVLAPAIARSATLHAQAITPEQSAATEIAARVRQTIIAERERQLFGSGDDAGTASSTMPFDEWKQRVVDPLIANARTCEQKMGALQQLVAHERTKQLMGSESGDRELATRFEQWSVDCLTEAYDRCVARHDIGMVRTMLSLARERELLGYPTPIDALVDGCLTFELDWALDLGLTDFWHMNARAIVPVQALAFGGARDSEAMVDVEGPKSLVDCFDISLVGLDPRARVEDFRLRVHEPSTWETALTAAEEARGTAPFFPREALPVDEIVVQFVPGRGELRQKMTCPEASMAFPSGGWPGSYIGMDPAQIAELAGQSSDGPAPLLPTTARSGALTFRFRASQGEIPQGHLFAVRQYENGDPFAIHATAMLLHTPKPMPPLRASSGRTPLRAR